MIKKNLQKVRIRKKNALELLNEDGLIIAVRVTNDGVGVLFKKLKITVLNLETGKQTRRRFKIQSLLYIYNSTDRVSLANNTHFNSRKPSFYSFFLSL